MSCPAVLPEAGIEGFSGHLGQHVHFTDGNGGSERVVACPRSHSSRLGFLLPLALPRPSDPVLHKEHSVPLPQPLSLGQPGPVGHSERAGRVDGVGGLCGDSGYCPILTDTTNTCLPILGGSLSWGGRAHSCE